MKKAATALLILATFLYFGIAKSQSMETNIEEIWKDVVGYEGFYKVSSLGRVKSIKRNGTILSDRILKHRLIKGYPGVNISRLGITKNKTIHRMMGMAFMSDSYFEGAQINHKNGIKTDNRIDNFEWVSASTNSQHAWDTGLCKPSKYWLGKKGNLHHTSKPIIQKTRSGEFVNEYVSATDACSKTGISRQHISQCCTGYRKSAGNFIWEHKC